MIISPIIDPYSIQYDSFAGDVYTLDTASITLSAGTLTTDTLTITAPTLQNYKWLDADGRLGLQGQTSAQVSGLRFFSKDSVGADSVFLQLYRLGQPSEPDDGTWERLVMRTTTNSYQILANVGAGGGSLYPIQLGMSSSHLVLNADGTANFGDDLTVGGNLTVTGSVVGDLTINSGDQILADDGDVTAPGISFDNSADTGMYLVVGAPPGSQRSIKLGVSGNLVAAFDTSGITFYESSTITVDSTTALTIEQAGGTDVLVVNTTNARANLTGRLFVTGQVLTTSGAGGYSFFKRNQASQSYPVLQIVQDSLTGTSPCLELDQDDVSEGFIDFVGLDTGVVDVSGGASAASFRIEIGGTKYVVACWTDQN